MVFIDLISNSKLDTFKQCKWKYRLTYVDKIQGDPPLHDEQLKFGQYIHKIFEEGTKAASVKELHTLAEHYRPQYKVPFDYNSKIETCLKNYFKFNAKLTETVATELKYELEVAEGIKVNGVIDRIVKGTENGYLVIDYKTSKKEKNKFELYQDTQLQGYCYAISKLYNTDVANITCAHYYPLTNNFVPVKYGHKRIAAYVRMMVDNVWKIRKLKKEQLEPRQNEYCDFCSFKNYCPMYVEAATLQVRLDEACARAKEALKNPG